MIDTKAPDQGLKLADDGRYHLPACVDMGWWRLDWDVDCVHVGVPKGGTVGAHVECVLFSTAVRLLPAVTATAIAVEAVRRGR